MTENDKLTEEKIFEAATDVFVEKVWMAPGCRILQPMRE